MSIRRRKIARKLSFKPSLFKEITGSNSRMGKYLRWVLKRGG